MNSPTKMKIASTKATTIRAEPRNDKFQTEINTPRKPPNPTASNTAKARLEDHSVLFPDILLFEFGNRPFDRKRSSTFVAAKDSNPLKFGPLSGSGSLIRKRYRGLA